MLHFSQAETTTFIWKQEIGRQEKRNILATLCRPKEEAKRNVCMGAIPKKIIRMI